MDYIVDGCRLLAFFPTGKFVSYSTTQIDFETSHPLVIIGMQSPTISEGIAFSTRLCNFPTGPLTPLSLSDWLLTLTQANAKACYTNARESEHACDRQEGLASGIDSNIHSYKCLKEAPRTAA